MKEQQYYRVAHEKIVHETVSHETIVIDLSTGTYFSFNPTASFIWNQLISNQTLQSVIQNMMTAFPAEEKALSQDIPSFIDALIEKKLLVIAEATPGTDADKPPFDTYRAPEFETHTDMESLLLADPIHEFND